MKAKSRQEKRPRWDGRHRQLWLGAKLLREYPRDAPGQIAVLEEFEAKGWPSRIDVRGFIPDGVSSKAWVKYTVKNLNRKIRGLRFHGNGPNHTMEWAVD
jgi:hypothetical protein